MAQIIGVAPRAPTCSSLRSLPGSILKALIGIRVSAEEEREGLDIGEHGNEAYHGFVMATSKEG